MQSLLIMKIALQDIESLENILNKSKYFSKQDRILQAEEAPQFAFIPWRNSGETQQLQLLQLKLSFRFCSTTEVILIQN